MNLKLAKTGGLTEALAMAGIAREAGLGVVVGCMMESHVAVGASAALASTLEGATTDGTATSTRGCGCPPPPSPAACPTGARSWRR